MAIGLEGDQDSWPQENDSRGWEGGAGRPGEDKGSTGLSVTTLSKAPPQDSAQNELIDAQGQPASWDTREASSDLRWLLEPSEPARPPELVGQQTPETRNNGQAPSAAVQDALKRSNCALGAASACLWWPALGQVAASDLCFIC